MYPTDPIRTASHIRLMTELKTLYVQGVIHADLKKALRIRLEQLLVKPGLRQVPTHQPAWQTSNYFSTKRIAVYTSIFGPVDDLLEPVFVPDNCDFFIFTDQPVPADSVWVRKELAGIPAEILGNSVLMNRYVKMFPDQFFPDYDYTIYLDGKYQARTDLTEFIQDMSPTGLRMFAHPLRTCVYQEIKTCIALGKGNQEDLMAYAQRLKTAGMPENYGMLEGGMIVREVGNSTCQDLMAKWWSEFSQYAKRDQISLPFVLWQANLRIDCIAIQDRNIWSDPAIRKYPHRKLHNRP